MNIFQKGKIEAEQDNEVAVFFACDDAYVPYLIVTITSLAAHADPKRQYALYVLFTQINTENQNKIRSLRKENISIRFVDVSDMVSGLKQKLSVRDYYSDTTYYRFFIPALFPQYDKAVYLDADTVLMRDVAGLYDYEPGNNLVGAVPDALVKNTPIFGKYVEDVLNVSSSAYFNAGVILINCRLFRKLKIYNRFIELLNSYTFVVAQDQDYLNILCQDKILWIDSAWNVQLPEENERDLRDIALIHYNLGVKPWHSEKGRYADHFWNYARQTTEYDRLRAGLSSYTEADAEKVREYGLNLMNLATEEIDNKDNFRRMFLPDVHRQVTRQEIVDRIARLEKEGRFDEDVEDDPPGRPLLPDEIDYMRKGVRARLRTAYAYKVARWFMNYMIHTRQLIFRETEGLENLSALQSGAVITCNHFNAMDSFAVQHLYDESGHKARKMYRVIKEGNYTSFPGFYGLLMRNCNTLPLSSNFTTMKKFMRATNTLLCKGHFVLVYAEQSMWWNYRKPKPLKRGAFTFAVNANVPVLPVFVTMEDTNLPGEGGFPVQAYTIHVGKPIYPDPKLSKPENMDRMMEENTRVWKETYERVYGIPLTYTTVTNSPQESNE